MNHAFKKFKQFIQEKEAYPIYVGIFLDKSNRSKLLKEVPADYEIVTADHVTLMFKDFSNWPKLGYKMGQTVIITVTWEWTKKGYMPSKGDIFISIEDQDWVDNYMGGDRWSSKGQLVSQIKKHISSDAKSIFG